MGSVWAWAQISNFIQTLFAELKVPAVDSNEISALSPAGSLAVTPCAKDATRPD